MSRHKRQRPTLADLSQPGPALSPADLASILGVSRELISAMCRAGEIPARALGSGTLKHWKIDRQWACAYCLRNKAA
jgi:hypothetical protein